MKLFQRQDQVVSASESSQAAAALQFVNRVSHRVIEAAGLEGRYQWEIVLVRARERNAMVMPNGKIILFVGLLPVTKTEAGLAAVISHEVGHLVAQHRAERLSQAILAEASVQVVDLSLAIRGSRYRPLVATALSLGAVYGFLLPYNRSQELEADYIGMVLMAKAGYDPQEAIALWDRMQALEGAGPLEFLATHPSPETRQAHLRDRLAEANAYYVTPGLALRHIPAQNPSAESQPTPSPPLATAPTFPVGYWLRFRTDYPGAHREHTFRLEQVEPCNSGTCYRFVRSDGISFVDDISYLFTQDYALVEARTSRGERLTYDPPLQSFKWPLTVGDSWSHPVTVARQGQSVRVVFTGKVVSYDSVATQAGTFLAFNVKTTLGNQPYNDTWFSPEVRTLVRLVEYGPSGTPTRRSELIDYAKTDVPNTNLTPAPETAY